MKRYSLILIIILVLIFSGCGRLSPTKIAADEVKIVYGITDISKTIKDESVIKELVKSYNNLKVKKADVNMDLSSTINVVFYKDGKEKAAVSMDKNGYLYLYRDSNVKYKVVGNNFDYNRIKGIYDNSETN